MAASRNTRVRLLHIRDEIDSVEVILKDDTFESYAANYTLRRAVERALQIISEAAKSLPKETLDRYSDAPWREIIGLGNILRHDYQFIEDQMIWEIATMHLPKLRAIVVRMLANDA